jgi:Trk K+ transport system NAD-binding subunit
MIEKVVVCGLGRIGWRVLDYLRATGLGLTAIDTRASSRDHRLRGTRLVSGDCRRHEVLEQAGTADAHGVLILTNDDLVNISAALEVRRLNPTCRIVLRLFNENLIGRLGKTLVNVFALSTSNLSAPLFALSAVPGQALGQVRVNQKPDGVRLIAAVAMKPDSPWVGMSIQEATDKLPVSLIGHVRQGHEQGPILAPDPVAVIQQGDQLIVSGSPEKLGGLLHGAVANPSGVRWAAWPRRTARMIGRTLREVDLPVKVCTTVLILVVLTSTLVLNFGVNHYRNWADAFFRTISLMATGSDMHLEDFDRDWQKVFASVLRICGAALTAAFTAIVTNYLLRARLAGALEVRRIPESGHVVVCGLGNIGFRVVETLVGLGRRVVAIEETRDSRFVATVRRLGVPVLIGDATVMQVLEQARVGRAHAIISATSHDLINLEVSLLARELNPHLRVILHLEEPTMAEGLKEAASVLVALSIPTLSAPAFVVALFGDRVQSVFLVRGRLLAALDLVVPPSDPLFTNQPLGAVAVDYGLVPIAVQSATGQDLGTRREQILTAGSRIIALMDLADLERLLRRHMARRDCRIELLGEPQVARNELLALVPAAARAGSGDVVAETGPESCLAQRLTRGEAEILIESLRKLGVEARCVQDPAPE